MTLLSRDDLPDEIVTARTLVRKAVSEDLSKISRWPGYEWPCECFDVVGPPRARNGQAPWWERIDDPDRCHYSVILPATGEVIGIHAFVQIGWSARTVANMGVRIVAPLCSQGYGTESLKPLLADILRCGISRIRLDVAASNARAVRCYKTCGMRIVEALWREHRGASPEPDTPKWAFAMPHLRFEDGHWLTRFYWMEILAAGS